MTSAAGTGTGSGLSEGLRGHSSSLNSFTPPEKKSVSPEHACRLHVQVLQGQGHCQFPATCKAGNLQLHQEKKCLYGGAPGVAGPGRTYWGARGREALKEAISASRDGPANRPAGQENARGCLFPPLYHRADPLDSTIQTERESECTSFVCRGRRTVEQRKKNKLSLALSAVSWGSLLPSPKGGPAALFSFPAAPLRL